MEQKKIGNLTKLTATDGLIHKIGTEVYAKSIILLPSDTMEMYEEVAEQPPYTKEQYDEKVAQFVREKYSGSEEFAIQRKAINAAFSPSTASKDSSAMTEYAEYNSFVEECKVKAKNPELYKSEEDVTAESEPTEV